LKKNRKYKQKNWEKKVKNVLQQAITMMLWITL